MRCPETGAAVSGADQAGFDLRYDRPLIGRAVRGFVRWRLVSLEPRLLVAEAVLLGCAAVLAAGGWPGAAVVMALLGLAPALLPLVGWAAHLAYKRRTLRAMGRPVARLTVSTDALGFRSDAGTFELPLADILTWRERPGFWLLLTAPNRFVILPTAALPPAVLHGLRERLAAIARER